MAADPRLPAAVSNAGALGSVGLWWADDAGDVVRETAALTDRPFAGNFVLSLRSAPSSRSGTFGGSADRVALLRAIPSGYVDSVHDAGGLVMHTVGQRRGSAARSRMWSGHRRCAGLGGRRARLGWRGNAPAGAGGSRRGGTGAGHCGRWDRRRSRSRGRARPRRAGRLAGHPVPAGRRDADPRGVSAPPDSRDRDRCRVVRQPL